LKKLDESLHRSTPMKRFISLLELSQLLYSRTQLNASARYLKEQGILSVTCWKSTSPSPMKSALRLYGEVKISFIFSVTPSSGVVGGRDGDEDYSGA